MSKSVRKMEKTPRSKIEREESRYNLRFMFASLFYNIIAERREAGASLSSMAGDIGVDKSQLTNWLGTEPNWQVSSIADIASGLRLKLRIHAIDEDGKCWSPNGLTTPEVNRQLAKTANYAANMHVVRFVTTVEPRAKGLHFTSQTTMPLPHATTSMGYVVPSSSTTQKVAS